MSETGRGGRYQRSTGGLVGAMLVTVVVIVGFVVFRSLTRADVEVPPEPVDYLSAVRQAEELGMQPLHPEQLPAGWTATSVEVESGERPEWALGVLTAEGRFIGLRQQDASAETLLTEHVDEDARETGEVEVPGAAVTRWTSYDDRGGDLGYVAEVDGETVLVYGSAPAEQIEGYLTLLTR